MLWRAHEKGLGALEYHLEQAVGEYEIHKAEAQKRAEKARTKAGDPPDKF